MPSYLHDYSRLINQVTVELPGSSDQGIRQALFNVFHEFFTDTNVWMEDISLSVDPDTTEYDLFSPEPGEIVRVMWVMDSGGGQQLASLSADSVLTIANAPNSADTWVVTVSKTVGSPIDREGSPEVPEWVIARWLPALKAGLMGNMMLQPSKPYSNMQLAQYHLRLFGNGKIEARTTVQHSNMFGVNSWAYPQSFRMPMTGPVGSDRRFT
jgi:hypothetical protein